MIYYVFLMIASLVIGYFIVQRILFKRRFERLKKSMERSENQRNRRTKNVGFQELFDLDARQIERIAKGLERFELEKGYVNTRLSLKSLATALDTNSSYLSKYINAIKGVNFSHYINTLRIHAIIEVLQVNSKIRSYTIDAIAEEAGFSNTRSFSNHFKRVTGINTSYFLKQLQKELDINEAQAPQTV
jgi:AraC-like DNA-binding protein